MVALVDILLSTYNGQMYLRSQLDSIIRQSFQDWRIIVRDDGSVDGTLTKVLNEYQSRLGNKMHILSGENIGVTASFSKLLEHSTAPYVMFCDQDDIWFEDKIQTMLQHTQGIEKLHSSNTPVLTFSNLSLVDQDGVEMGLDFWHFHGINPYHKSLNRLLLQNVVTGCACMCNRALVNVSMPIPNAAILHDWWLALNAALFGELGVVDRPTINYRQHSANQVGARNVSYKRALKMLGAGESIRKRLDGIVQRTAVQASALLSKHNGVISPAQRQLLEGYANLPKLSWVERKLFLFRERVFFTSTARNICLILF